MIRLVEVSKRYGATPALSAVTLQMPSGGIYGLIGPNGAGKTTVLRLIAGLARPTSGRVEIGTTAEACGGQPRVGYLPQRVAFNALATARETLQLFSRLKAMPCAGVAEALRVAGLGRDADRPVGSLSGGMRQRLGLAIACLGDPEVLLLDEPDAGLDPRAAIELRHRVRALAAAGRTVVFSSHSLPELETVCDRLAILLDGRVVREGTVEALRNTREDGSLERLFLETTS